MPKISHQNPFSINQYESSEPNIAFAGLILSVPVLIVTVILVFAAGRPMFEALLIGCFVQFLLFSVFVIIGYYSTQTLAVADAKAENDIQPSAPIEHWRTYKTSDPTAGSQRVAVISADLDQGHRLACQFAGLGYEVHHCNDREAIFGCVSAEPDVWDLVVCDMDSEPDTQSMMYDLEDFRAECPDMKVVFFSDGGYGDDPSANYGSVHRGPSRRALSSQPLVGRRVAAHNSVLTAAE